MRWWCPPLQLKVRGGFGRCHFLRDQYWFLTCMKKNESMWWSGLGLPGDCLAWQKLKGCNFLTHYKHDKCQALHDFAACSVLHVHTASSDFDHISRSVQNWACQTERYVSYVGSYMICSWPQALLMTDYFTYLWMNKENKKTNKKPAVIEGDF